MVISTIANNQYLTCKRNCFSTMAAGGVDEEEMNSFEIYDCSVCLESLVKKHPRLLQCGHTFCTPCLQKVKKWNEVVCPKCRSRMRLPPGGVEALPKNTDLSKMRERELALTERNENNCQMCKKKGIKAEYICTSCVRRLICQACYDLHNKVPAMKNHNLLAMKANVNRDEYTCERHNDVLEYFCPSCVKALCAQCICDPQHRDHTERIVDYKSGIKPLKDSMEEMKKYLKENEGKFTNGAKAVEVEVTSLIETKNKISSKIKEVEEILNQLRQMLTTIVNVEAPLSRCHGDVSSHLKKIQEQVKDMEESEKLPEKQQLLQLKRWQENYESIKKGVGRLLETKVTVVNISSVGIVRKINLDQIKTKEILIKEKFE